MTYANGTSVEYVYDEYDVPITCNYAFFDDGGTWFEVKAEWWGHNVAYQLNYEIERTKHVDLDYTSDEEFGLFLLF